ncbi:MAG: RnfH family protein [Methylococcaceae bacterium]|nr:RnfH family protein [Methylococcaceae bacterium]
MNVGVCYAEVDRQLWMRLEVPESSTIEEAINLSGLLKLYPEINLGNQKVGIFGKIAALDTPVKEGDRRACYARCLGTQG